MEIAIGQEWARKRSNVRVEIRDRMFHLGEWWVLLFVVNPELRRRSWWTREASFIDRYETTE